MKNHVLITLRAVVCIVLCAAVCVAFCACGKQNDNSPAAVTDEPMDNPTDGLLTDAQLYRLLGLAAAFRQFGEYNVESSSDLISLERMVFFYYTDKLDESSLTGYGRVPISEADTLLYETFGSFEMMDILRTQYDSSGDQLYFVLDDDYYVHITDNSAYSYEVKSASTTDIGVDVMITVSYNGTAELNLAFVLRASDSSSWGFIVESCGVQMWQ